MFNCIWGLKSQTTKLRLDFFINNRKSPDILNMSFKLGNEQKSIEIRDSFILVPDFYSGKKLDMEILTSKYKIVMDNLVVGWDKQFLMWKLYLDFPPFKRLKPIDLPKTEKKIKWLCTLKRGNGTNIMYYGYSKLKKNNKK